MEADDQRERAGVVWSTLRRIASELDRLGARYAIVGGLALQHFGCERSTQDVDLLLESQAELDRVHAALVGHGYFRKSPQSRHIRDDTTRVRIEFLIAGEFPGDGQPKPVQFPRPADVAEVDDAGLHFVNLPALIEMKLASAKTAPHRIKDRADVLELIHLLKLGSSFPDGLNAYVRAEFRELAALPPPREMDD